MQKKEKTFEFLAFVSVRSVGMNVQQIKLQVETVGRLKKQFLFQQIMRQATRHDVPKLRLISKYSKVLWIVLVPTDTNTNKLIFNKSAVVRTYDDAKFIYYSSFHLVAMTLSREHDNFLSISFTRTHSSFENKSPFFHLFHTNEEL